MSIFIVQKIDIEIMVKIFVSDGKLNLDFPIHIFNQSFVC